MSSEKKPTGAQEEVLAAEVAPTNDPAAEEEESLQVRFRKPYHFEGKDYDSVDLSGLEDTTAEDLAVVGRSVTKTGAVTPMPEMTMDFVLEICARVCGLPIEFFKGLPARDAIRVKNKVTGFLYGGDGDN